MGFKDQGSGDERNERNAQKPGSDISIQDAFEVTTVKKNSKQQRCGHEKIKVTSKLLAQRNLSVQPYIKSLLAFAGVGGYTLLRHLILLHSPGCPLELSVLARQTFTDTCLPLCLASKVPGLKACTILSGKTVGLRKQPWLSWNLIYILG